jgi:hypothetical protein
MGLCNVFFLIGMESHVNHIVMYVFMEINVYKEKEVKYFEFIRRRRMEK